MSYTLIFLYYTHILRENDSSIMGSILCERVMIRRTKENGRKDTAALFLCTLSKTSFLSRVCRCERCLTTYRYHAGRTNRRAAGVDEGNDWSSPRGGKR